MHVIILSNVEKNKFDKSGTQVITSMVSSDIYFQIAQLTDEINMFNGR